MLIIPISTPLLSQMLLSSVPETVQTGSAWPLSSQARCTDKALHLAETSSMEQTRYLSSLNSPATLQPEPRRPGVTSPALVFGLAASPPPHPASPYTPGAQLIILWHTPSSVSSDTSQLWPLLLEDYVRQLSHCLLWYGISSVQTSAPSERPT